MKMYVWEEAGMKGGPCPFELPKGWHNNGEKP